MGDAAYTWDQWTKLVADTFASIDSLSKTKGAEYTGGNDDRLQNFRRNAAALGLKTEQVWAVYAGKHWDSIQSYVKDISKPIDQRRTLSEPIDGRIDDLIVYLLLFKAMVEEANG